MVKIRKRRADDGFYYEIDDFQEYVGALSVKGIESPKAKYRVFASTENERLARERFGDRLDDEIASFFRLGPSSGIDYRIVDPSEME